MSNTEEYKDMNLLDRLCAGALAGQQAILDAQLKAGFPLKYVDDNGDYVQKNPDGSITILENKE